MHPETAETKYLLAKALLKYGQAEKANALTDTILTVYKEIFQEENPEFARIYALKANALLRLGQTQEAENYFRKSVDIVFGFLGRDNPVALSLLREWGVPEEYYTKVR
ncbi:MAG: tetratricopeptide repeat protein [Chlorobi bacterium]|nr:tetratricopeptide repeat protein [Chlorobiota bacterium]